MDAIVDLVSAGPRSRWWIAPWHVDHAGVHVVTDHADDGSQAGSYDSNGIHYHSRQSPSDSLPASPRGKSGAFVPPKNEQLTAAYVLRR
jgi:hypothetical protein